MFLEHHAECPHGCFMPALWCLFRQLWVSLFWCSHLCISQEPQFCSEHCCNTFPLWKWPQRIQIILYSETEAKYRKSSCFANKGPSSQGYAFSSSNVWMWELDCEESWVPKNWCFWTWCWRRLLRVPWNARRSNQSILKEISPGCSLEGMMLKMKLHNLGHLMRRVESLEKTLMLGGIGVQLKSNPLWIYSRGDK